MQAKQFGEFGFTDRTRVSTSVLLERQEVTLNYSWGLEIFSIIQMVLSDHRFRVLLYSQSDPLLDIRNWVSKRP